MKKMYFLLIVLSDICYRIMFTFPDLPTFCMSFRSILTLLPLAEGKIYNEYIDKLVGTAGICCKPNEEISFLAYEKTK